MTTSLDWNDISICEYDWDAYDEEAVTVIGELGHGGYDWSYLKVYRNNLTGLIAWGEAAGCSCDSFSMRFRNFNQLAVIGDWNGFANAVRNFGYATSEEKIRLLAKVSAELVLQQKRSIENDG